MDKLVRIFESDLRTTLEDKINEWLMQNDVQVVCISYAIGQEKYGALVHYNQQERSKKDEMV